jgi:hypothetical protein
MAMHSASAIYTASADIPCETKESFNATDAKGREGKQENILAFTVGS